MSSSVIKQIWEEENEDEGEVDVVVVVVVVLGIAEAQVDLRSPPLKTHPTAPPLLLLLL